MIAPGLSGLILAGGGSALAIAGVGAQLAVGLYSIGSTIAACGSAGDVLLGIAVNFVSGAISSGGTVDGTGGLHELGDMAGDAWKKAKSIEGVTKATALTAKHVAGHAVLGGLSQEAMGGRFQDGFLSAGASTLMMDAGLGKLFQGNGGPGGLIGRTAVASIIGGTAAEVGGGKFANGAMTAAWQHLLNHESPRMVSMISSTSEGGLKVGDTLELIKKFNKAANVIKDAGDVVDIIARGEGGVTKVLEQAINFENDGPEFELTTNIGEALFKYHFEVGAAILEGGLTMAKRNGENIDRVQQNGLVPQIGVIQVSRYKQSYSGGDYMGD